MTQKISYPWPLACGALLVSAMAAFGHGGATGIVGERMMGMMMLGEQVKVLAPIADNPGPQDLGQVREAAAMIEMHAGAAMTDLFPEGSIEGPSEAKPAIWQRWEEFAGYSNRLGDLGRELDIAAQAAGLPRAITVDVAPALVEPVLSEWDRMSFASLMGIATPEAAEIDPTPTASIETTAAVVRTVAAIYADITDTCASCHAAFRQ
jgi:cytochrome c556